MTRIYQRLSRFVATNWIFKASRTTLCFFKKGLLFPSRYRLPVMLFSALVLLHLVAVSAAAQLSVIALEKNRRRVSLPTEEVTRILGATRGAAQPITVIPMSLEVGDELIGNTGAVAVKVRCNSAEASLSGKFRVRMLPSTAPACNLYFGGSAGARLNTSASGPTSVVSGAFTLGTSRTRYEVEIPDKKRGGLLGGVTPRAAIPIAKVYEGEAVVQSPLFSGSVKEGQKLVAEGLADSAVRNIAPDDYIRAAEIYARLDVSQANVANEKELEAAYRRLLGLHRDVLEKPGDQSKLMALRKVQEELGVPESLRQDNPEESKEQPNRATFEAPNQYPVGIVKLALDSLDDKWGEVAFDHENHSLKNYNPDGKTATACVECHHTDQPKENLKAPLVTSERSVVLTADVLKDAAAGPVKACRSCHLQAGDDSKALPVITKDTKQVKLDNEVAYHTNCFVCHDAAIKAKRELAEKISGSDPKGCIKCHVAK